MDDELPLEDDRHPVGVGYRPLAVGEKIRRADEMMDGWGKGGWEPVGRAVVGKKHDGSRTIRRYDVAALLEHSDGKPEIITRKVRVLSPMEGEIEVTLNITGVIEEMVKTIAKHAYRLSCGRTESKVEVCAPARAVCTPQTLICRNAHLALNNEKRDQLKPKFKVLSP